MKPNSLSRTLPLAVACLALACTAPAQDKPDPTKRGPADGQRPPPGEFRGGQRPAQDGQRQPQDGQRQPQDGQRPGGQGNFGGGRPQGDNTFSILNDEQRNALREAFGANGDQMRDISEKLMTARKSLQEALWAEKIDTDGIRKKAEEIAKLEGESAVLRAKAFAKIRPMLSADQIERMKSAPAFGGPGPGQGQGQFQGRPQGGPDGQPGQPGNFRRPNGDGGGDAPKRGDRRPDAPPKQ